MGLSARVGANRLGLRHSLPWIERASVVRGGMSTVIMYKGRSAKSFGSLEQAGQEYKLVMEAEKRLDAYLRKLDLPRDGFAFLTFYGVTQGPDLKGNSTVTAQKALS
uniref:Uncharacterized protein n=1 Tax=Chromera velia CCMP2878 TaxID=1169474 RepID=A0A0G4GV69_9ALVE|eukprot:Cvel_23508.t1-p1 / transcript=Cvel_23508.t1 / gene=Cvel_23508 / organism=Chromera_velia_CCMP2878 / gene_product=hypothetical protein / transcript_product=hypothetical protein / location=Cvel_scaffold2430:2440-2757(-) / protein_length=106 / sequence_SO=supercontig / SO=protein_coding / is_pseudo=false